LEGMCPLSTVSPAGLTPVKRCRPAL